MLKTIFMGTPEIAVPALQVLAQRTQVRCVVTQPDRPAGRGHHLMPPAIKLAATELGLSVWQPESLKGQASAEQLQGVDLFVVMAYGELLRRDVLALPTHGCINLHASLLPRWRGASPLQAALRAGDTRAGITVMRMVPALDAGPIFLSEECDISPRSTLSSLHDQLAQSAALALSRFLDEALHHEPIPQDESLVTVCRKLTSEDGHLDFTQSAEALERWVRAYTPAPGCWALADGERLRILEIDALPGYTGLAVGAVLVKDQRVLVGCADGACAITRLQAPGKRAMTAAEFLNGHRLSQVLL